MKQIYRPVFDRLERRDVPSAVTPSTVNLTAGVLTVLGTPGPDAITISNVNGMMSVSDSGRVLRQYAAPNVAKIVVDAGFGNDTVLVRAGIAKPAFLYGGYGNDQLFGGAGNDQLYGGAGADALYGRGGNDQVFGGSGSDAVDGGLGANTVVQGTPARMRALTAAEQTIVDLVNAERASLGLAPVTFDATLTYAAGFHSTQMATRSNAMQHTLYGVIAPTPASRLDYAGYDDWQTYGENIAFGYTTALAVMQAWMNSPGHRENILNPAFTQIGVGIVADSAGYLFWTQEFGAR